MKKLTVYINKEYSNKVLTFIATKTTIVKELWNYVFASMGGPIEDIPTMQDYTYYRLFYFVISGEPIKAFLDYNLLEFLDNHNVNYEEVEVFASDAYGIGGEVIIDKTIKLQVNSREPMHNNPHIHISRPNWHNKCYRLDIETLTQMKGDKEDWKKEFNLRERKKILKCIKENKETLIDYYNKNRKGEYIEDSFYIYYEGLRLVIK